jgi:hypothetical protein
MRKPTAMPAPQRAPKPRARLTEDQAIQIFKSKLDAPSASKLATIYHVCEKTVRDIWTGRTWSRETCHLDPSRTLEIKQTGRPKGCKDSQPRKKRGSGMRRPELSSSESDELSGPDSANTKTRLAGATLYHREQAESAIMLPILVCDQLGLHKSEMIDTARSVESSDWHRSDPSLQSYNADESRPSSISVDEQLHDWHAFWSRSHFLDPFGGFAVRRLSSPLARFK